MGTVFWLGALSVSLAALAAGYPVIGAVLFFVSTIEVIARLSDELH